MKNWPFWLGSLTIIAIILVYFWSTRTPAPPPPAVEAPPPAVRTEPPAIKHPVAAVQREPGVTGEGLQLEQPLPSLENSDARMAEVLAALVGDQQLDRFFLLEHVIERIVVTVDNLPRAQLPATHRPLKKVPGDFLAEGPRQDLVIDPANYRRYDPLVDLLAKVDEAKVVAVYTTFYPLFQQAYEKLGYPGRYFNDRLIEVLDHLLEAPGVSQPVRLIRPKYYYQFDDPRLESLSAGQKALIRTGPENMARLKRLISDYRQQLSGAAIPR